MIDQLVRYAQQTEGLALEPGLKEKEVKWAVDVHDGRFLGLLLLCEPKSRGRRFPRCPDLSPPELVALGGTAAHFLAASCDQVALYRAPDPNTPEGQKIHQKHNSFVDLLREAAQAVPELGEAAAVLDDPETLSRLQAELEAQKARPTDLITVRINGCLPLEDGAWLDWWRNYRSQIQKGNAAGRRMVCLATGELVEPAATHPKIAGLADVGGLAMGTVLIGYDKDAFLSYGLKQSENGAMSEKTATAYRAALNRLLAHHSQKLASARIAHWYQRSVPPENDAISWLDEPPEDPQAQEALRQQEQSAAQQRAAELLDALRTGKRPELLGNRYYALTLSGSGGRVMVRDWMEGSFEELVANVGRWFGDLCITNYRGNNVTRPPGIERVITCLLAPRKPRQDYDDWVKPLGGERVSLWRAALGGGSIPYAALARVVVEHKAFMQTGQLEEALKNKRDQALLVSLLQTRMALLKAYHLRKGGTMESKLNENHPEPAYHCGRVLAVLARLQAAALRDVNAGVVQRFYAAASATPALVLPRLVRNANFHLQQVRQRNADRARWFQGQLAAIYGQIEDRLPPPLTLEQQSLFDLGYYHQMARDWPKGRGSNGQGDAPHDEPEQDETSAGEGGSDE